MLVVTSEKCIGCRACENSCPCGAIKIKEAGKYTWEAEKCAFCRLCERSCKNGAIAILSDRRLNDG
ncbi:MAG: 4Fe-4S binding protein [Holosporales bacterium]|nr:4Fe-4S binding protein [Holosporales bacterium]